MECVRKIMPVPGIVLIDCVKNSLIFCSGPFMTLKGGNISEGRRVRLGSYDWKDESDVEGTSFNFFLMQSKCYILF